MTRAYSFALALSFASAGTALACSATTSQEPPRQLVVMESWECPLVLPQVQFASGDATLRPESAEMLQTVADLMKKNRDLVLVEIEGHADATEPGSVADARAAAALEALVARGVALQRLRARGYGSACSLADIDRNETPEEARARDRRITFKIVATREGDTGVELGCANAAGRVTPADR